MNNAVEFAARAVVIGAGATVCMDLWALFLRLFGVPSLDFALLGRWVGHFGRGRFAHENIRKAAPVRGERLLGWMTHYAIGITFASVLLAVWGLSYARSPTIGSALLVGLLTLPAPLLVMQPAMGLGIASSRTPRPWVARVKSVATHVVFGVGMYVTAVVTARLL